MRSSLLHIATASLLVLVAMVTPAAALTPDEEQIVSSVENLYRADGPAAAVTPGTVTPDQRDSPAAPTSGRPGRPGCGTSALVDAFEKWDQLSPEAQERLKPLMDPPGGMTPAGVPAAPDSSYTTVETAHFIVHFKATGPDRPVGGDSNRNRIPDYIDNACAYLEAAYAKQVGQMGFKPPPDAKETVYFRKLNHNGLTHPMPNQRTWLELNSDILGTTKQALGQHFNASSVSRDPAGCEAGLLKAVCAHEFFHAVQARYKWGMPKWWGEGTADWMGNHCFPESGFYLNNVGPHLESPHVSLFAQGDFYEYSASLWATFLAENFSPDLIKQLWESCAGGVPAFEAALSTALKDFPEMYMTYASYCALLNFKDGAKMPKPQMFQNEEYPKQLTAPSGREPQHYGSNIWRLVPRRPGTLHIEFRGLDRSDVRAKVIVIDRDNKTWTIQRQKSGPDGLTMDIPGFGEQNSQVLVVVGAFSPGGRGRYSINVAVR